jgi:murein DD-endopeptidase MepM/ murein hydrolase activator NlpD
MMRSKHFTRGGASILFPRSAYLKQGAALILAALAGGCSAEITRFDLPGFSLTDDKKKETTTASLQDNGRPSYLGNESRYNNNGYGNGSDRGGYASPRSNRDSTVAMAPLSEPQSGYGNSGYGNSGSGNSGYGANNYGRGDTQPSYRNAPSQARPGDMVEVQQGDTLYALSRRYRVSVSELMEVNNLTNPALKPGQRIYLPSGVPAQGPVPSTRPVATMSVPTGSVSAPPPSSRFSNSYTVHEGESLYAISKSHGVTVAELQNANGITDPRTVRAGTVLKVPQTGADAAPQAPRTQVAVLPPASTQAVAQSAAEPAPSGAPIDYVDANTGASTANAPAATPRNPSVINRRNVITDNPQQVAAASPPPASRGPSSASDKLRWPVQGKILTSFGQRDDGTHNDGINLSVPMGTPVHAAEGGTVAYAGSELKGYGNLILVRHDNGWVTAYAHADEILVKRGDKVQRGQIIAKAGRTGSVDQPQVHFELRQGSKPVDPVPFMERL